MTPTLLWFRHDLRLADHPALSAALARCGPVVPFYLLDEVTPGGKQIGGAGRWWLHHSLAALGRDLAARGAPLVLRRGQAAQVIRNLAAETGAGALYLSRDAGPPPPPDLGLETRVFVGGLLHDPERLRTKSGGPFKVFTPFWRALRARVTPGSPLPTPERIAGLPAIASEALDSWRLLPRAPDWSGGLAETWQPGEAGARARLSEFLVDRLAAYSGDRDRPDRPGTSRLSPHLHWGEISPRQVWQAVTARQDGAGEPFLRQLAWREFSAHLLAHWPELPTRAWRPAFEQIAWRDDPVDYRAWCRGVTGYPLVDAGMRELAATGWMHNRVRMVAASFLVKHLLIDWRRGEAWFWDQLVDGDLANNAASWQWVTGSGADAAPYFRVFNPVLQSERFDPAGHYIRRWIPELAGLPDALIHQPWRAAPLDLAAAGVRLGETYPEPIVDHAAARARALAAYQVVKERTATAC